LSCRFATTCGDIVTPSARIVTKCRHVVTVFRGERPE
jgi:hypothetical protein